jgi:hypothetical protein
MGALAKRLGFWELTGRRVLGAVAAEELRGRIAGECVWLRHSQRVAG